MLCQREGEHFAVASEAFGLFLDVAWRRKSCWSICSTATTKRHTLKLQLHCSTTVFDGMQSQHLFSWSTLHRMHLIAELERCARIPDSVLRRLPHRKQLGQSGHVLHVEPYHWSRRLNSRPWHAVVSALCLRSYLASKLNDPSTHLVHFRTDPPGPISESLMTSHSVPNLDVLIGKVAGNMRKLQHTWHSALLRPPNACRVPAAALTHAIHMNVWVIKLQVGTTALVTASRPRYVEELVAPWS